MPASYGYASVVTSRPCARASLTISSMTGVSAMPALLMCTTCNGAPVSPASASAALSPERPGVMCTWIGVLVCAATRNTASSSSRVGADVDRTLAQATLNALRDLGDLLWRRGAIRSVGHRHPGAGIVHHRHSDFD